MNTIDYITATFFFVIILLLPGFCLKRLLFKKTDFDPVESISISFGLSLLYLCIPLLIFYLFQIKLLNCAYVIYALIFLVWAVSIGRFFTKSPQVKSYQDNWIKNYIIPFAIFVIAIFFTYRYVGYAYKSNMADLWYYLSYVRKMFVASLAEPSNPFIKGEGVEFVYGYNIWLLISAIISKTLNIDPLNLWSIFASFLSMIYLSALYCIAKQLFERKIAFFSMFIFFFYEGIFRGLHHFIHSPRPATINIFVLSLLGLAFVVRYLKYDCKKSLFLGAGFNFIMAFLHFVEPITNIMVLGLFLVALTAFGYYRLNKILIKRVGISISLLVVGSLFAFLIKYNLAKPHLESFLEPARIFSLSPPTYIYRNIFMVSPGLFLGNVVTILTLPLLLLVSTKAKKDIFLLFIVSSIVGMFIIQFNPLLATSLSKILTSVFVKKGLTINWIFCFIIWGYVVYEFIFKYRLRVKLRIKRKDAVIWTIFFLLFIIPGILYFFSNIAHLTNLARQYLNISQRHELKLLLKGFISLAIFLLFMSLLVLEFAFTTISRFVERLLEKRKLIFSGNSYLGTTIIISLIAGTAIMCIVSEKGLDKPYPKFYSAVASPAIKYMNNYKQPLTVLMRNLGDISQIDKYTLEVDTGRIHALTPHYGVSMYKPSFKLTKGNINYKKRYEDVMFLQSGQANTKEFERIASLYLVDLVYLNRKDKRNEPIISLLRTAQSFDIDFADEDAIVFKYAGK